MKVLITCKLPQEVVSLIQKEHEIESHEDISPMPREKLLQSMRDKDGLLCNIEDKVDAALLEKSPRLKMIANYGVGFNNIDVQAATRRSIPISNTPGVLTDATADTAFSLILATARRIVEGDKLTRRGEYQFWAPLQFLGRQVSGTTLGIIGMGRIGKAVARRARGFDMKVIYYDNCRCTEAVEKSLGAALVDLDTLISTADFISLHVPLMAETHHLINQERLSKMKPTAFLINTSRGPVVDEQALLKALQTGKIAGFAFASSR